MKLIIVKSDRNKPWSSQNVNRLVKGLENEEWLRDLGLFHLEKRGAT